MATNYTLTVPERNRKWRVGALVRDGANLYRVSSGPIRYHEDCLPIGPSLCAYPRATVRAAAAVKEG